MDNVECLIVVLEAQVDIVDFTPATLSQKLRKKQLRLYTNLQLGGISLEEDRRSAVRRFWTVSTQRILTGSALAPNQWPHIHNEGSHGQHRESC